MDISTKNSGYESLFDRCSSLCSELVKQGCKFSFSLKLEESFSFSLSSEKGVPRGTRKRPPSYQRRQHRRKTELLQRRTEFRRTNEAAEDIDNDGRRQEGADLLDKKMVSSRQMAKKVDSTVDNNTPLNLNPRAIYPRGSVESVEQVEDNCVNRDENNVDNKSPQSKPPAACPVDTGRDGGSVNTDGGTEKPTQGTKKYQEFLQEFRCRASRYREYKEGDSGGRKFFKWTEVLSHVTYDENFDGNLHWICDVCHGYNKSGKDIDDKNPAECSHCRKDWLAFEC